MSATADKQIDLVNEQWRGAPPPGNCTADWPFWLVVCTETNWSPGRPEFLTRGYRYVHDSEKSAETEALRLANKYPGYEFAVVKSVAVVRYRDKERRCVWEEASDS